MSAAERFYKRLEPIAFDDDGTLAALTEALMAPIEIAEIARDTDDGLIAWEPLFDPDTCPAVLLDWLAVYNGVILPPSALTDDEKRSRIKQAAGRYRGTEQAWIEEIQRALTGEKVVRLLTFVNGDRWKVTIITRASETPDPAAVERTAFAQKPAGILLTFIVTDEPLIDEGSLDINSVGPAIDAVTLDDIT